MIWTPAFYFVMACGGLVLFMILCDVMLMIGAGCTIDGFMVQPMLQLVAMVAVLATFEQCGTTAQFSLSAAVALPLVAYVAGFALLMLGCPPLAQRLSSPASRSFDRAALRAQHLYHLNQEEPPLWY